MVFTTNNMLYSMSARESSVSNRFSHKIIENGTDARWNIYL